MTEDHRTLQRPDEAIGDLGASPGPADIADIVNPANDGSPAQGLANKVIENIQPNSNSAQNLSDALGNPSTDDAPKLQDALDQPAELLKPGREVGAIMTCPLLPLQQHWNGRFTVHTRLNHSRHDTAVWFPIRL